MKLVSWNVNGVRASMDKGLRDYVQSSNADVICLQEVKAEQHQADLSCFDGYQIFWNPAQKKGYSGTAVFVKPSVLNHRLGIGQIEHDTEGRVITVELDQFYVVNVYTPNAQDGLRRLPYRLQWDAAFREYLKQLEQHKPVLSCGDFNVAHHEIDIARPKDNRMSPGFSDQERASFSELLASGFIDTFRHFNQEPNQYSWWSYRAGARTRNVGWRIDYWLASQSLQGRLQSATIRQEILGSDHCPVELELQ